MTRDDIARIIRESRQMAGLTQLQVGDALNRPQTTIAAWEAGRSQPDANTLFELFRVLGRSVDEAFGFTVESFNVTAHERTHIEKYRTLDSYGKGVVDTLLDSEYRRCIGQNLTDYFGRLDQLGEEIQRIQKAQESSERTADVVTEEIRRLQSILDEIAGMDHDMDTAMEILTGSIAAAKGPQFSPAPQEGIDTTPPSDATETRPEDE